MRKHHKHRNSMEPVASSSKEPFREFQNVIVIILLSTLPYYPSLTGDFVFDDAESIVNNPIVNGEESITQILTRDFWGKPIRWAHSHKSYRPVTTFTFWINYKLHGTTTFGYHFVNLILHASVSILFYRLLKKLEVFLDEHLDVAFAAAVLFAIHPVHTEAVANITGRAELLMALFALMAIHAYVTSSLGGTGYLRTFAFFVVLSTFSKEQGIMTIPMCLFLDLIAGTSSKTKSALLFTLFFCLCCLRCFANGFETAKFTRFDNAASFLDSTVYRGINYSYIWLYHVFLLIFPSNLCFDYSMGCISTISSFKDLRALSPVLIVLVAIIGFKFRSKSRLAQFAVLLGVCSFLPSSNIFFTVGFTVAERILYMPSAGFCILCAIIFKKLSLVFNNTEVIAMTLMLLAASKSYKRSEEWRTELSLYSTGLQVCPMNAKIHYNLAKVLGDNGLTKEAERNYWNAIKLNPTYEQALNNLGNLLEKSGDSKTAESLLTQAVVLRPSFAAAWMNLGITQMNLEKYIESEKAFRNSLKLRPKSAHCFFNLGVLYQKQHQETLAMSAWINATKIDPKHAHAWTNLFVVLDQLNMCSEVVHLSLEALSNVPSESSVLMQIGSCYAKLHNFEKAEKFIKNAISIKPTSSLYRSNLGVLYQRMNRLKEASDQYRIALILDNKNTIAVSNLPKLDNFSFSSISYNNFTNN